MTTPSSVLPHVQLTPLERNVNAVRALIKLVPHYGDALDQLAFGTFDEIHRKRVEATLEQILQLLHARGREPIYTEELVYLFERAQPKIARAVSEDVRERFRDLLTNAASLPSNDTRWAQASLAEQLLSELDAPALAILAQIARCPGPKQVVSKPLCQVVSDETFTWENPVLGPHSIGYSWPVVAEWMQRLREKRLVGFSSSDSRGGFGTVNLLDLGTMLVEWSVCAIEVPSGSLTK